MLRNYVKQVETCKQLAGRIHPFSLLPSILLYFLPLSLTIFLLFFTPFSTVNLPHSLYPLTPLSILFLPRPFSDNFLLSPSPLISQPTTHVFCLPFSLSLPPLLLLLFPSPSLSFYPLYSPLVLQFPSSPLPFCQCISFSPAPSNNSSLPLLILPPSLSLYLPNLTGQASEPRGSGSIGV